MVPRDCTSAHAPSSVLPHQGRGENRVRQCAGCFTEVKTMGPSTHLGLQILGGRGHLTWTVSRKLWFNALTLGDFSAMRTGLLTHCSSVRSYCLPASLLPSFFCVCLGLSQSPPLTWTEGLCGTQPPTPKQAAPLPTVSFSSQLPPPVYRGGQHFPVFSSLM